MDAIITLLATLVAIHALEGGFWVRRSAFAFLEKRRTWRWLDTRSPFGNADSVFVFGGPLPPIPALVVVDPWPVFFTADHVYNVPLSTLGMDEALLRRFVGIEPEQAARTSAEGRTVYVGRTRFVDVSSSIMAAHIAEVMRQWAALPPNKRARFSADPRRRHDRAWIADRLALHAEVTRVLRPLANVMPFLLLLSLAGVLTVQAVFHAWPVVLATNLAALIVMWIGFFRGHRRLYPSHRSSRWYQMLLFVVAPLSAARAHAWLARDALVGADPLDVAAALQSPSDFLETAGRVWRDLAHPLALSPYASLPRQALEAQRASAKEHARALIESMGGSVEHVESPPPRDPPSYEAYCPRCRTIFADADGDCSECVGVARRRFESDAA